VIKSSSSNLLLAFAASALILAGCATRKAAPPPAAPLAVHGALSVVELAPVHLAVENLYPKGTKVRDKGVVALLSGETLADVATNAETQVLRESPARPDLRIIMTVAEGHYRIVARKSAGITSVADLRGKRIATLTMSSAGYFLSRELARANMTLADVQVKDVTPFSAMVTQLVNKEVDGIAIWEPYSENALRALGADAIALPSASGYYEIFNLNTTAANLAHPEKRAAMVQLVRGIIDATESMNRNPRRGQELVAEAGNYTVEEVAASWSHQKFVASFAENMLDVMAEEEVWVAAMQKRAPRPREELAKLIDRSVYDEAVALRR
jgi:NitT/TauT family transport system substrate-binding protein